MTVEAFTTLLHLTVTNPRAAAARLKSLDLPVGTGWTALLLVSVLSAFMGFLGLQLSPIEVDPAVALVFASPLRTALIQFVVLALTGALAYRIGHLFRGTGTLAQSLVLVAWVQVPPILLQIAQIVAMLVLPSLAPLIGLAGFALYAVLLSLFIAELHGFRSGPTVFVAILVISFGVAIAAAFLFVALFGVPAHV